MSLANVFFGPLRTGDQERQRIGTLRGLPILGLGALSSAAYGPEALLTVLLPLGIVGIRYVLPLTLAIVAVLVAVALSYRQTIAAYPNGGGSYTVARENIGRTGSLVAAAALGLDYLLTVAVGISAGVGAAASAVPALLPHTLPLCLGVLLVITVVNLRGVRASGGLFSLPTVAFVGSLGVVIVLGLARAATHGGVPPPVVAPPPPPAAVTTAATPWLLLRAFANGTTAMTGVEAVSNAVPLFRQPRVERARRTLAFIMLILMALLVGVALLCRAYHVTATTPGQTGYQSVLSQLTEAVFGRGPGYGLAMASVVVVLALSANTSFADFPRVARLLAGDHFLPEPFEHRGRRLVFSYGIGVLGALSAVLLVAFEVRPGRVGLAARHPGVRGALRHAAARSRTHRARHADRSATRPGDARSRPCRRPDPALGPGGTQDAPLGAQRRQGRGPRRADSRRQPAAGRPCRPLA
jgi:amino acid transporter